MPKIKSHDQVQNKRMPWERFKSITSVIENAGTFKRDERTEAKLNIVYRKHQFRR